MLKLSRCRSTTAPCQTGKAGDRPASCVVDEYLAVLTTTLAKFSAAASLQAVMVKNSSHRQITSLYELRIVYESISSFFTMIDTEILELDLKSKNTIDERRITKADAARKLTCGPAVFQCCHFIRLVGSNDVTLISVFLCSPVFLCVLFKLLKIAKSLDM